MVRWLAASTADSLSVLSTVAVKLIWPPLPATDTASVPLPVTFVVGLRLITSSPVTMANFRLSPAGR